MVKTATTDTPTVLNPSDVMAEVLACIKKQRPVMLMVPSIGKSKT